MIEDLREDGQVRRGFLGVNIQGVSEDIAASVDLEDAQIEDVLAEAETALGEYVTAEGTVEFDLSAHIVTGTKP